MNNHKKFVIGALAISGAGFVTHILSSQEDLDEQTQVALLQLRRIAINTFIGIMAGSTITFAGIVDDNLDHLDLDHLDKDLDERVIADEIQNFRLMRICSGIHTAFENSKATEIAVMMGTITALAVQNPVWSASLGAALLWGYSVFDRPERLGFPLRPRPLDLEHLPEVPVFFEPDVDIQIVDHAPVPSPIIEMEWHNLIALDPEMVHYVFDPYFICTISYSLMMDPVMVVDSGHSYDRQSIEQWFQNSDRDPMTTNIVSKQLVSNIHLRKQILNCLMHLQHQVKERHEPGRNRLKID